MSEAAATCDVPMPGVVVDKDSTVVDSSIIIFPVPVFNSLLSFIFEEKLDVAAVVTRVFMTSVRTLPCDIFPGVVSNIVRPDLELTSGMVSLLTSNTWSTFLVVIAGVVSEEKTSDKGMLPLVTFGKWSTCLPLIAGVAAVVLTSDRGILFPCSSIKCSICLSLSAGNASLDISILSASSLLCLSNPNSIAVSKEGVVAPFVSEAVT